LLITLTITLLTLLILTITWHKQHLEILEITVGSPQCRNKLTKYRQPINFNGCPIKRSHVRTHKTRVSVWVRVR